MVELALRRPWLLGCVAVIVALALTTGAAQADSGASPPRCDLRKVDWRNFTYPDFVLRNGSKPGPPVAEGWHVELAEKEIVYGDMRGDGTLTAFVPVYSGGPADHDEPIFVFDADPSCKPRLAFKTGGLDASPGKVVDRKYVFDRLDSKLQSERIEVQWLGGRFMEAKVPLPPPPPVTAPLPVACDLHKVDWMSFAYPGFVELRNDEGADRNASNGEANCDYSGVEYGDLDGNGSPEAYVAIQCHAGAADYVRTAVIEAGLGCHLRSLGLLDAGGTGDGKVAGRTYVMNTTYPKPGEDSCCGTGKKQWTYQLVSGKWTFTTQTPGATAQAPGPSTQTPPASSPPSNASTTLNFSDPVALCALLEKAGAVAGCTPYKQAHGRVWEGAYGMVGFTAPDNARQTGDVLAYGGEAQVDAIRDFFAGPDMAGMGGQLYVKAGTVVVRFDRDFPKTAVDAAVRTAGLSMLRVQRSN